MSQVTNVMLSVGSYDIPMIERVNAWLEGIDPRRISTPSSWGNVKLIAVQDMWGGVKAPECNVYAGVLNHADVPELVEMLGSMDWRDPNVFQLFVKDQEQQFFRLWMIRDSKIRQYAPETPHEDNDGFWSDEPGLAP